MQPPRNPGPPRGPSGGPSGNRPNNFSGPRPSNNSSSSASSSGGNPNYKGNKPYGSPGAPPRPYQGGGGSRPPYAPRPAGSGGFSRPLNNLGVPRGSGYVKEKSKDDLRINTEIKVPSVRLVGEDGEMVGVVDIKTALQRADEAGLDLVEISPQADPPVCKILDYGKYKYEQEKKNAEAKKKQKVVEVKELKLRPGIGDNDYQIKVKHAKEFLEEGNKVKFTLRFKGREQSHAELGFAVFNRLKTDLTGIAKIDQEPKFEGRQVMMLVSPAKA